MKQSEGGARIRIVGNPELSSFVIAGTLLILAALFFYFKVFTDSTKHAAVPGKGSCASGNGQAGRGANSVVILFGSQSGTAEAFARSLGQECQKRGVQAVVYDAEQYRPSDLKREKLVIVICATYGDGQPTGNMKDFHDWIMDDTRAVGFELESVKYTVFGLGDRQYTNFCREGIVMDTRFAELGAERFYGMGIGDADTGNLEGQFEDWQQNLWPAISRHLGAKLKEETDEPVEPEYRVKYWESGEASLPFPKTTSILEPTQRSPVAIRITRNEELLKVLTERSTRMIEFDLTGTLISYQAGDYLGIFPCNPDSLIEQYFSALKLPDGEAERIISLQNKQTLKNMFPARVSVRTTFKWYLDLAGEPKKTTLRAFAYYCTDAREKEKLLWLLSLDPAAQKEFDALSRNLRTVLGFLRRFPSMNISLGVFLEYMPRLAPRYFSISSDPLYTPMKVGITVGVVKDGLCTPMLQKLIVNDSVFAFVMKSNFHLSSLAKDRPIIMIGPGTGVAPFIGFIQRRYAWKREGAILGEAMLFFGCRRKTEDHIYEDFTLQARREGVLSAIEVAYSREQPEKIYVQHRLKSRGKDVWRIIDSENGKLYICGDAKQMVHDVESELVRIAQREGGLSKIDAEFFFQKMQNEERYLKDVW